MKIQQDQQSNQDTACIPGSRDCLPSTGPPPPQPLTPPVGNDSLTPTPTSWTFPPSPHPSVFPTTIPPPSQSLSPSPPSPSPPPLSGNPALTSEPFLPREEANDTVSGGAGEPTPGSAEYDYSDDDTLGYSPGAENDYVSAGPSPSLANPPPSGPSTATPAPEEAFPPAPQITLPSTPAPEVRYPPVEKFQISGRSRLTFLALLPGITEEQFKESVQDAFVDAMSSWSDSLGAKPVLLKADITSNESAISSLQLELKDASSLEHSGVWVLAEMVFVSSASNVASITARTLESQPHNIFSGEIFEDLVIKDIQLNRVLGPLAWTGIIGCICVGAAVLLLGLGWLIQRIKLQRNFMKVGCKQRKVLDSVDRGEVSLREKYGRKAFLTSKSLGTEWKNPRSQHHAFVASSSRLKKAMMEGSENHLVTIFDNQMYDRLTPSGTH